LLCRRGHDDLGDHYLDCGDLANALKCYSRARDYCTTARHLVNMCLNVIKVSLPAVSLSYIDLAQVAYSCVLVARQYTKNDYCYSVFCEVMNALQFLQQSELL